MGRRRWLLGLFTAAAAGSLACTGTSFLNNIASLGGANPGGRGNIRVSFINNTPFRAIFTFGSYDPQNEPFRPQFRQFTASANAANRLEGNTESSIFTFQCGRAISVGGAQFIERVRAVGQDLNENALQPGIAFSDATLDSPDAEQPTAGRDGGVVSLLGEDYECESLLIYTLEVDLTQPDGFRVDVQVIPPGL